MIGVRYIHKNSEIGSAESKPTRFLLLKTHGNQKINFIHNNTIHNNTRDKKNLTQVSDKAYFNAL